ncbi:CHASE2 domain-containing protein [Thalassospira profundimaris]|nr:CHASE2 domain-containing protein [Thalassospira profundimaris]
MSPDDLTGGQSDEIDESDDATGQKPLRQRGRAGPGLAYLNWAVITFLLAGLIVFFEPEEFTQPVDEYSYQLFNRLFGAAVYDAPHKDDIGIVLFDQKSMYDLDTSWPPLFMTHGMVLRSFMRKDTPLPLAVFIDFTLQDARNTEVTTSVDAYKPPQFTLRDDTLSELVRIIEGYRKLGIPVYVSAGRHDDDRFPEVLADLKDKVKLVAGWGDARSSADIRGLNYALFPNRPGLNDDKDLAQKPDTPDITAENNRSTDYYPAAALQIYLDLCARRAGAIARGELETSPFAGRNWNCDKALVGDVPAPSQMAAWQQQNLDLWRGYARERPMNLIWPDRQPDYAGWPVLQSVARKGDGTDVIRDHFPSNCPAGQEKDFSFLVGLVHDFVIKTMLGRRGEANFCGPFDTVTAGQAQKGTPDAENSWIGQLGGRVIMYSFNLQGLQDIVHPPTVEADIAGVNVHAMALENLLHFGPAYLSDTARTDTARSLGFLDSNNLELLTMLGLFLIRLVFLVLVRLWGGKTDTDIPGRDAAAHEDAADEPDEKLCTVTDGAMLYYRTVLFDLLGWCRRLPGRVMAFSRETVDIVGQKRVPVFVILVVEACVVVAFVFAVAFWLEFSVLRIAPSNWLSILGLAGLTYPVYIRALFSQSVRSRHRPAGRDAEEASAATENLPSPAD